jgi:ribose-phosphate pyrophosphokinase
MRLLCGSSNPALCVSLQNEMGIGAVKAEVRRFPDTELYCRLLDTVKGEDIVLVQSTYPDANALEFLILARLLRDQGAAHVTGVIPYFGYARQDRVFRQGESFTARTMALLLSECIDDVVSVNLHKEATLSEFGPGIRTANVSVMRSIGEFMKGRADLVLSPDKGAIPYAREAAGAAGCPYDNLEKTRIDGSNVVMAEKDMDVRGRSVCIVDDIIATGGTIARASEALRAKGAAKVYACCAHGLFTGGGIERLSPLLDGLHSSDTIENGTTSYSAARPIAERIRHWRGA